MNGVLGMLELRDRRGSGAEVPVIALTASVMETGVRCCGEVGMNDFLGKPLTLDALSRVLEGWLAGK